MREGEAISDALRGAWEQQLGTEPLAALETMLTTIVGDAPVRLDAPGGCRRTSADRLSQLSAVRGQWS